jgi:hypothetical protein
MTAIQSNMKWQSQTKAGQTVIWTYSNHMSLVFNPGEDFIKITTRSGFEELLPANWILA